MSSLTKAQLKLLERYVDYVCGKVPVLSSEDQQALQAITELPDNFLDGGLNDDLASVTSVNLSYFTSVKKIGSNFMYDLDQLSSVNLSALSGVTSIGDSFLAGTSIQSVDLSPLKRLKRIPDTFLGDCDNLQKLDLSSSVLPELEEIGDEICFSCSSLTSLNMSGLSHLKSIGDECFAATGLTSIDFSNTAPESIDDLFLQDAKVDGIDLSHLLSKIDVIPNSFLSESAVLEEIDLSNCCHHVTEIQDAFAFECSSLTKISLSGLTSLKQIRRNFLSGCESLIELDLSCCPKLEIIDPKFCAGCDALASLDASNLACLSAIGSNFCRSCKSLTSVDFTGTENVTLLGKLAFVDCTSLAKLNLDFLANSHTVGESFLVQRTTAQTQSASAASIFDNALAPLQCEFLNLHKLANVESIHDSILKEKVVPAVERAAVRQMIVRMVYTLGFRTSKLVPAGKAIRACRPRRLVIEFLLPSPSIYVPLKWGFSFVFNSKHFVTEWKEKFL